MFVRVGVSNRFDEVCEQQTSPGTDRGNIKNNLTKEQVRAMKLNTRVNVNSQVFSPVFLKSSLSRAIAITTAISGSVISSAVIADEVFSLEEIVVTAQKREQNLQEVPVAVTAFAGDALEQTGIQNIADLERITPNTTLRPSRGTSSTLTAYIRGVGQNDPLWGFEPGVGMYIDDVYFARPQGAMVDVYDVERIEVLRGPQGTLYGKNTIGGAIKYVTKRMTGDAEAAVKFGVGTYNQRDMSFSGQIPLIEDKLYLGGAIASFQRDGFGENKFLDEENYNKDVKAARLSLEYTPREDLFFRLAGDITKDDSNQKNGSRNADSLIYPEYKKVDDDSHDVYDTYAGVGYKNEVENSGGSLTIEWDINEQWTFKSITAYREGETLTPLDFDGTPYNTFDLPARYSDHQTTQEFQLNYTADNWSLVTGVYYFDGYADGVFDAVLGNVNLGGSGVAEIPGQQDPTSQFLVAPNGGSSETESQSIYAHLTWDLTEKLTLNLGARYNKDEKEAEAFKYAYFANSSSHFFPEFGGSAADETFVTSYTPAGGADGEVLKLKDDWSQFTPKAGLDYQLSESTMIYASYSEAFKSGGMNLRYDELRAPTDYDPIFDPEEIASYELGIKTDFLDGRVRLNAAVFYSDYENVQITTNRLSGTSFIPLVVADNEQTIQGVEIELQAQLTENLSMMLNYGLTDAEWDKFNGFSVLTGDPEEQSDLLEVSNVPKHSGVIGFNYDMDLGNAGTLMINANASYTGEIYPEVGPDTQPNAADSYTLYNLSAMWLSADEHWTVALHGRNLTDEIYRVAGYQFVDPVTGVGGAGFVGEDSVLGFYGDPRTVTLNVGYNF